MVGMLGEKIEGHRKKGVWRKASDFTTAAVLWCPKPRAKTAAAHMGVQRTAQEFPAVCPLLPVASQSHRSCRPRAFFLSPLLLAPPAPPRELTILALRSEFATSDFKEWLHIPSCHHHFRDPWQRDLTVVATGICTALARQGVDLFLKVGGSYVLWLAPRSGIAETLLP